MLKQNGLISAEPGLKSTVVTASSPLKREAIFRVSWENESSFSSVQVKRERAYLCTDVCHCQKHRWRLLFSLHLDCCMHRAAVIPPLWAEVTSRGVAFVRCPPSALRSWFARWAAHSLERLERFLPDRPAFCSRRKLAIISCAQKLDMNITRIIQHKGRARIEGDEEGVDAGHKRGSEGNCFSSSNFFRGLFGFW